jgi:hypothetical protein
MTTGKQRQKQIPFGNDKQKNNGRGNGNGRLLFAEHVGRIDVQGASDGAGD